MKLRSNAMRTISDDDDWSDVLHIYPQLMWHDDAYIFGNRAGLTRLRDAINKALELPASVAECESFTSDGEGYSTYVRIMSDKDADELRLPYADLSIVDTTDIHPGDLMRRPICEDEKSEQPPEETGQ